MHDDAGAWRRKLVVLACAALLTATSTVGCAGRCRAAGVVAPPVPEPPKPAFEDVVLGRSVEGNDLVMSVLPGGPETVLVIGGVHGSEPTSVDVARGLLELLREQPEMARGKTASPLPSCPLMSRRPPRWSGPRPCCASCLSYCSFSTPASRVKLRKRATVPMSGHSATAPLAFAARTLCRRNPAIDASA